VTRENLYSFFKEYTTPIHPISGRNLVADVPNSVTCMQAKHMNPEDPTFRA
jgi:hypothetical protein